jgi:predicted enzyme related to lactoylglutathione lyase
MKMGAVVLDSCNSEELSDFYSKLLHWTKERQDEEWIVVFSDQGEGVPLVFQQIGV